MAIHLTVDSIDRFRAHIVVRGQSQSTARAYRADLTGLLGHLQTKFPTTQIPPHEFEEAAAGYLTKIRDDGAAARTIQRKLTAFRSWARWAGYGPEFLSDYTAPTPEPSRPHPLPNGMADVRALLDAAGLNQDMRALVCLQGMMGLRVGEALSVSGEDVDLDTRTVRVQGKGRKGRWVPIPTEGLAFVVPSLVSAGVGTKNRLVRMPERTARKKLTELGAKVGIKVASHDLRATFATHVYSVTKDLRTVQDLLGHSDPKTTLVYTERDLDTLRAAVEAVSADS